MWHLLKPESLYLNGPQQVAPAFLDVVRTSLQMFARRTIDFAERDVLRGIDRLIFRSAAKEAEICVTWAMIWRMILFYRECWDCSSWHPQLLTSAGAPSVIGNPRNKVPGQSNIGGSTVTGVGPISCRDGSMTSSEVNRKLLDALIVIHSTCFRTSRSQRHLNSPGEWTFGNAEVTEAFRRVRQAREGFCRFICAEFISAKPVFLHITGPS
ncbi:hypothetical protein VTK73DRAFT_371 [Phialemonium thermophilum]|uniref:Uncharacterized protein n=1 Tax=Phialemonium thermophilum TaxID=223376 RepID=A0ABR3XEM3_9PEZI